LDAVTPPLRLLVLWCGFVCILPACAAPADASAESRAEIQKERQALLEGFGREEAACQKRFAVSSCVNDVQVRRRAALTPLREREMQLNEEQRRLRSQEREAARLARLKAHESQAQAQAQAQALDPGRADPTRTGRAAVPLPRSVSPRSAASDTAQREAEAADRVRAAQQRRDEAKATQVEVARRLAQRKSEGKQQTALPTPGAASIPAGLPKP